MKFLGPLHIAILVAILTTAAVLSWWTRRHPASARPIEIGMAAFILLNEAAWLSYEAALGGLRFPDGLPLQLCDLNLYLAVIYLFRPIAGIFDYLYYGTLAGTSAALLTPDLWAAISTIEMTEFFLRHGVVEISVLYLIWAKRARPRPGSVWRAFAVVQVYAAAIGAYNWAFGTNFFYLREKPANASLLNWLGPWPVYIFVADALALGIFALLWLPFRRNRAR